MRTAKNLMFRRLKISINSAQNVFQTQENKQLQSVLIAKIPDLRLVLMFFNFYAVNFLNLPTRSKFFRSLIDQVIISFLINFSK